MKKLSAFGTNSHDNNFNLLRIILASLVIYSHSYVVSLGGQPQIMDPFERFSGLSLGHLSVNAFFVISGFLVTKSYTLKKSLLDYCIARILRIYPAFTVAILFSALVVGATFSDLPLYEYYKHTQTANYILHNLPIVFSQLEYSLPGVFTENPLIYTVNIPIWTLPWELKMYILLAFWGLIGFLKRPWLVASITSFFVICFFYNDYFGVYNARDIREGLQFLSFFYLGATVYLFRSKIVLSYRFLPVSFVLLALFFTTPLFRYIFYLSLVYWIFLFAYLPAGILRNYNKFGDYS
jgi:peptidoglycan/LPS O-acetylase OafA/YrhL